MTIAVIVATYGSDEWAQRAAAAVDSARSQSVVPEVIHMHGRSLHEARNNGAKATSAESLSFLDADDSLDYRCIEEMMAAEGDVIQPSTLGVYPDGTTDDWPILIPPKPSLLDGNHLILGCLVDHDLFEEVGGFRDLPCLEDYDLWIRCWLTGAVFATAPEAIYRVGVNTTGRNTSDQHGIVYNQIRQRYQDQFYALQGRPRASQTRAQARRNAALQQALTA